MGSPLAMAPSKGRAMGLCYGVVLWRSTPFYRVGGLHGGMGRGHLYRIQAPPHMRPRLRVYRFPNPSPPHAYVPMTITP
jgi:hypothetical protein